MLIVNFDFIPKGNQIQRFYSNLWPRMLNGKQSLKNCKASLFYKAKLE